MLEDYHDLQQTDFLYKTFTQENEFADCFLSADTLNEFLAPSAEKWYDFLPKDNPAVITLDGTKLIQWELAKKEIGHIQNNLKQLLSVSKITDKGILLYCLGPESRSGVFCRRSLA